MNYNCSKSGLKFTASHYASVLLLFLLVFSGCSTSEVCKEEIREPESRVRELCEEGRYQAAMKELVSSQADWKEYTAKTGRTSEGAAGFEYMNAMEKIANKGDAEWGGILDDEDIPYLYKTEMIFEILEYRFGKGAVYMGEDRKNFIVPRFGVADLDAVMAEQNE